MNKAKELLLAGEYTCVVYTITGTTLTSNDPGIKPPMRWLRENPVLLQNADVADKVIGLAAAMLFAHGGVKAVWGGIMSKAALAFLQQQGIGAEYGQLVPQIMNRAGDGLCPMEQRALACETAAEAFAIFDGLIPGKSS